MITYDCSNEILNVVQTPYEIQPPDAYERSNCWKSTPQLDMAPLNSVQRAPTRVINIHFEGICQLRLTINKHRLQYRAASDIEFGLVTPINGDVSPLD